MVEKDGDLVDLPKNYESMSLSWVGTSIVVSTHFGIKLIWDGLESVYVKVIE